MGRAAVRPLVFKTLLPSRFVACGCWHRFCVHYQAGTPGPGFPPRLREMESLAPRAEAPFFFDQIGRVFPAQGERRYRVAFLAGCIANVAFARLMRQPCASCRPMAAK